MSKYNFEHIIAQPEHIEARRTELQKLLEEKPHQKESGEAVDFYETERPEDFLNGLVTSDFILHGTTRKIDEVLIPTKSQDRFKESGNRTAVYMTNTPAVAIFNALAGGLGMKGAHHCVMEVHDDRITYPEAKFEIEDPSKVASKGYVYVFDKSQADEHTGGEYLAYRETRPLAAIKIGREDFNYPIELLK